MGERGELVVHTTVPSIILTEQAQSYPPPPPIHLHIPPHRSPPPTLLATHHSPLAALLPRAAGDLGGDHRPLLGLGAQLLHQRLEQRVLLGAPRALFVVGGWVGWLCVCEGLSLFFLGEVGGGGQRVLYVVWMCVGPGGGDERRGPLHPPLSSADKHHPSPIHH